jgi:hypothetical protein
MKSVSILIVVIGLSITTWAKDHSSDYQVGMFKSTETASDGTYSTASCGGFGCSGSAYNAHHNFHLVETKDGVYAIDAPTSVTGTVFASLATNGNAPTIHKAWFMDDLHDGDKVLFASKCGKHNFCQFWLPDPSKTGREILTTGRFAPAVAKTNTTSLCGTGKLSAAIEEEVCKTPGEPQAPDAADQSSDTSNPESEPAPTTAQPSPRPTVKPVVQVVPVQHPVAPKQSPPSQSQCRSIMTDSAGNTTCLDSN